MKSKKAILNTLVGKQIDIFKPSDNSAIDIHAGGSGNSYTLLDVGEDVFQAREGKHRSVEFYSIAHIRSITVFG